MLPESSKRWAMLLCIAEIGQATEYPVDGPKDVGRPFLFHEVAIRAAAQCMFRELRFFMHADDQNSDIGRLVANGGNQIETGVSVERHIDDREVMPVRADTGHRVRSIFSHATDEQIALLVEKHRHPFTHNRMVINNQNSGVFRSRLQALSHGVRLFFGTTAVMIVPLHGWLLTFSTPSRMSAR